jgi:hypothetical protein
VPLGSAHGFGELWTISALAALNFSEFANKFQ